MKQNFKLIKVDLERSRSELLRNKRCLKILNPNTPDDSSHPSSKSVLEVTKRSQFTTASRSNSSEVIVGVKKKVFQRSSSQTAPVAIDTDSNSTDYDYL